MDPSRRLLILGASTRAAAHSAVRAGIQPFCSDIFLDGDLQAVAEVFPVEDYPRGLTNVARNVPSSPWMYTGALENHPDIIARISADRPLLGNPPGVLRRVRDPVHIRKLLVNAGQSSLALRSGNNPPKPNGQWMLRRRDVAGCSGIHVWNNETARAIRVNSDNYFQQRVVGTPISALFVSTFDKICLVGMTRQYVGVESVGAPPFAYCGSLGPIQVCESIQSSIERSGIVIARKCGLRGLFGCDFLLDGTDAWLTEVNPRYTASVEILEHAFDMPILMWHCQSFAVAGGAFDIQLPDVEPNSAWDPILRKDPGQFVGKLILFAVCDIIVPSLEQFIKRNRPQTMPYIADVPAAGSLIKLGRPICTVLAAGHNTDDCQLKLQQRVCEVSSQLYGRPCNPFDHNNCTEIAFEKGNS